MSGKMVEQTVPIPQRGDLRSLAREWVLYLHSGQSTKKGDQLWQEWLAKGPENAEAYTRAEQIWRDLSYTENLSSDSLSVSPHLISAHMNSETFAKNKPHRSFAAFSRIAALLAVCVGIIFAWQMLNNDMETVRYASENGEIKRITLADGSIITLGGDSAIVAHISEEKRHIILLRGRAAFDVASDPTLPFTVLAVQTKIRVVGTVFDVQTKPSGVQIWVSEGIVDVGGATPVETAKARLTAGQQVEASPTGVLKDVGSFQSEETITWQMGRLSYVHARLEDVVAEVNRYRTVKIILADKILNDIHLSMTMENDQTDQLLAGLITTEAVIIERSGKEVIIRAAK